ncbi:MULTISPECIES: TIGR02677 family protein [unclassified Kribbella]|uniref:TIGR02677 family protein n=1 Tax=unclassified Kribbella TaxID=2644121 RepID=UPI0033D1DBB9
MSNDGPRETDRSAFGIDAFELDDRLRLFHWTAADKRTDYLQVLRAMDRARANYQVLVHANDILPLTSELDSDEITRILDQLHAYRVVDRSYDGARAASLAEYRNRHYVYQFTEAGYRAYRAVEDVLGASVADASLSRLVLPELLDDLVALGEAVASDNSEDVYRRLTRLDSKLSDLAARAARFYLMLGDLAKPQEASVEIFLAHKDALLAHMREFTTELARYAPKLAAATAQVESHGVQRMVELAAEADERIFRSPAERVADWHQRWRGLTHWFVAGEDGAPEVERLQSGTVSAIAQVLAMLRRLTEARTRGVSRESQLRHLAEWFARTPNEDAAHALFGAVFNLRVPRHVGVVHADPELIPARRSWWEAPAVPIARTLVETGKPPSPGRPARIERNDALRRRLREAQLAEHAARIGAASSLADGLDGRVLDEDETELLFELLSVALTTRVPTAGTTRSTGSGTAYGIKLRLVPHPTPTVVDTVRGRLHLDRHRLTVEAAE